MIVDAEEIGREENYTLLSFTVMMREIKNMKEILGYPLFGYTKKKKFKRRAVFFFFFFPLHISEKGAKLGDFYHLFPSKKPSLLYGSKVKFFTTTDSLLFKHFRAPTLLLYEKLTFED